MHYRKLGAGTVEEMGVHALPKIVSDDADVHSVAEMKYSQSVF